MKNPHEAFSPGWSDTRKRELIVFRCDAELFTMLRQEAEAEGVPLSEAVRDLCERGLR